MNEQVASSIACPKCKHALKTKKDGLFCTHCSKLYPLVQGVPVFLDKQLSTEEESVGSYRDTLRKNKSFFRVFKKLHRVLGPPDTTYERRKKFNDKRIPSQLHALLKDKSDKSILNVGSSGTKAYASAVNLDIDLFPNVDVVGDGKSLPFIDHSFDIVLIEMVLEHVDEAEKVIKEAYRVLKKGGEAYISIPFTFVFHGSPNDFNRYTVNGLKRRLELQGFTVSKAGVLSGPSSTMSQMLRYYIATLFSFNSDFLFSLLLNIVGWITFPIKYIDIVLNHHKKAELMASTIYAIGVK